VLEIPQSFIVREECQMAASENGFRRVLGEEAGWAAFGSTTVSGTIHLAAAGPQGPWFIALDHVGVIEELRLIATEMPGPGLRCFTLDTLSTLHTTLQRVYQLAASLPVAPLQEFQARVKELPRSTEIERLVVQRIGQDIFRASLMEYWQGRCPLTGIVDTSLLRASHIIPWRDCNSDTERLNIYNGLLLSALWDAAFDQGLVSFGDDGKPEFSPDLGYEARAELRWRDPLRLTSEHCTRLAWHRAHVYPRYRPEGTP